jgi:hypothetical protein
VKSEVRYSAWGAVKDRWSERKFFSLRLLEKCPKLE